MPSSRGFVFFGLAGLRIRPISLEQLHSQLFFCSVSSQNESTQSNGVIIWNTDLKLGAEMSKQEILTPSRGFFFQSRGATYPAHFQTVGGGLGKKTVWAADSCVYQSAANDTGRSLAPNLMYSEPLVTTAHWRDMVLYYRGYRLL